MRSLTLALALIATIGLLSTPTEAPAASFNVCVHSKGVCVKTVYCHRRGSSITCTFNGRQFNYRRQCQAKVTFPRGWFRTPWFWTYPGRWTYTTTAHGQYWHGSARPTYINLTCR